jgi:hypothetical protein
MKPAEQLAAIKEVEQLLAIARARAEAGEDATIQLHLARRALRDFGRRRAKKAGR